MSIRDLIKKFNDADCEAFRRFVCGNVADDREMVQALLDTGSDAAATILAWQPFVPRGRYVASLPCKILGIEILSTSATEAELPHFYGRDKLSLYSDAQMTKWKAGLLHVQFLGDEKRIVYKFTRCPNGAYELIESHRTTTRGIDTIQGYKDGHSTHETICVSNAGMRITHYYDNEKLTAVTCAGAVIGAYLDGKLYNFGDLPEGVHAYSSRKDVVMLIRQITNNPEHASRVEFAWDADTRAWNIVKTI